MSLVIFLAFLLSIPCLGGTGDSVHLAGDPWLVGVEGFNIEMLQQISLALTTFTAALTRSSVDDVSSTTSSPCHVLLVSVPRKLKWIASSLAAWLSPSKSSLPVDRADDVERWVRRSVRTFCG